MGDEAISGAQGVLGPTKERLLRPLAGPRNDKTWGNADSHGPLRGLAMTGRGEGLAMTGKGKSECSQWQKVRGMLPCKIRKVFSLYRIEKTRV